eukprot:1149939-Pelagomonas_calceolata.AAC.2
MFHAQAHISPPFFPCWNTFAHFTLLHAHTRTRACAGGAEGAAAGGGELQARCGGEWPASAEGA